MSDSMASRPGPAITDHVDELETIFADEAALQDAISRLIQAGFDRADRSPPEATPPAGRATPDQGAAAGQTAGKAEREVRFYWQGDSLRRRAWRKRRD